MLRTKSPFHQGYTLVELLVVVGLIGLVSALALPTYASTIDKLHMKGAVEALSADLRLAQARAMREGHLARLRLRSGPTPGTYQGYTIEVATGSMAQPTCTDTNFKQVKVVDLELDFRASISNPTFECLVYEPTGRTAWTNPTVMLEEPVSSGEDLSRYFDSIERSNIYNGLWNGKVKNLTFSADSRLIGFPSSPVDTVIVDLGQSRTLTWVCAQVHRSSVPTVYYPAAIQVYWLPDGSDPFNDPWRTASDLRVTPATSPETKLSNNTEYLTCPKIYLDQVIHQPVRYLRVVFDNGAVSRTVYLDEIKLSEPSLTVQNEHGRGSQTITITPVTGRVSAN